MNTENNIYLPEDKPFSCNYLLSDEYNIISSKYPVELSVLHVNCRSMHNLANFEKFTGMLKVVDDPFSATAITEILLFESDAINLDELHNYQLFLKCKQAHDRGGGIALHIHGNVIQFFDSELSYNCSSFESLTLKFCNTPIGNITIATIYRPANDNTKIIDQFDEDFHQYLTTFGQSHSNSYICMDDFIINILIIQELLHTLIIFLMTICTH